MINTSVEWQKTANVTVVPGQKLFVVVRDQ